MTQQRRALLVGARALTRKVALVGALFVALGSPAALASEGPRPFHCDGTDPALFLEREEAGWLGYGETWDHDTCAEGATTIYAPGARQWADMRPKWSLAVAPKMNYEAYAHAFPVAAFGGLGGVFGIAWFFAFLHRRRRVRTATLACPSCDNEIPVHLDDPALRNFFCPMCGAPCALVNDGKGGTRAAGAA